jgi:hypothetical protein
MSAGVPVAVGGIFVSVRVALGVDGILVGVGASVATGRAAEDGDGVAVGATTVVHAPSKRAASATRAEYRNPAVRSSPSPKRET